MDWKRAITHFRRTIKLFELSNLPQFSQQPADMTQLYRCLVTVSTQPSTNKEPRIYNTIWEQFAGGQLFVQQQTNHPRWKASSEEPILTFPSHNIVYTIKNVLWSNTVCTYLVRYLPPTLVGSIRGEIFLVVYECMIMCEKLCTKYYKRWSQWLSTSSSPIVGM